MKYNGLIYLASPYTHESKRIRDYRKERVAEVTTHLIGQGYYVYSPIVHTIGLSEWGGHIGTSWDDWKDYDSAFVRHMDGFAILKLSGWKESVGVSAEHALAFDLHKSRFFVDPNLLELERMPCFLPSYWHKSLRT